MRLLLQLDLPAAPGTDPVDVAAELLSDNGARLVSARWAKHGLDPVPEGLTHIGWFNPNSGVMHRNKMDLRPGDEWSKVYLYGQGDHRRLIQVDGGEHCSTLGQAFERAEHKVTFTLPTTGEYVRLVREPVDCGGQTAWVFRNVKDELRDGLVALGASQEVIDALTGE